MPTLTDSATFVAVAPLTPVRHLAVPWLWSNFCHRFCARNFLFLVHTSFFQVLIAPLHLSSHSFTTMSSQFGEGDTAWHFSGIFPAVANILLPVLNPRLLHLLFTIQQFTCDYIPLFQIFSWIHRVKDDQHGVNSEFWKNSLLLLRCCRLLLCLLLVGPSTGEFSLLHSFC